MVRRTLSHKFGLQFYMKFGLRKVVKVVKGGGGAIVNLDDSGGASGDRVCLIGGGVGGDGGMGDRSLTMGLRSRLEGGASSISGYTGSVEGQLAPRSKCVYREEERVWPRR